MVPHNLWLLGIFGGLKRVYGEVRSLILCCRLEVIFTSLHLRLAHWGMFRKYLRPALGQSLPGW